MSPQPPRPKPHLTVATLGPAGHGKTTLSLAISARQAARFGHRRYYLSGDQGFTTTPQAGGGVATSVTHCLEYESRLRRYSHIDHPSNDHHAEQCLLGPALDGAILVVAADQGVTPEAREHIRLAHATGAPGIVTFLNKVDLAQGADLLDLAEWEIRDALHRAGYPGDDLPIVRGDALPALRSDGKDAPACACIDELVEAIDSTFQPGDPLDQQPFLMAVEDVFHINTRGTVDTGSVARGQVRPGDAVEIVGLKRARTTTVTGVETFAKPVERAGPGDNIGVLLRLIERNEVERGQVLASPGSVTTHGSFEALIYFRATDQGGAERPFVSGQSAQFYLRTAIATGQVSFPVGVEECPPGGHSLAVVVLDGNRLLPLEEGLPFAIRGEGARNVGVGRVIKPLN